MNKVISFCLIIAVILVGLWWFFVHKAEVVVGPISEDISIVAFGDSLVQGVGATSGNDFISVLSKDLAFVPPRKIINLGVSGNTTADAIKRIDEVTDLSPDIAVVLFGGNDFLRRLPREETFRNLEFIIQELHKEGIKILLLGVRGGIITDQYDSSFKALAKKYEVPLVEDVLGGLLTKPEYMSDSIHPNDEGYKKIADRVFPELMKLIRSL